MKSRIALFSTLVLIGCQDVSNKVVLLDDFMKFSEEMRRTSKLLCKSDDTNLQVFLDKTKDEIIVIDKSNTVLKIWKLKEICLKDSVKIWKLSNGDIALSLLQGSGTGFNLNTLFVLKENNQGEPIFFKISPDQIFAQAQKISMLKKSAKNTVEIQDSKTGKAITLSIPADDLKYIKTSQLNWNNYLYSNSQLSFDCTADRLIVNLCVGIYPENSAGEILLGSISFDLEYQTSNNTISINLSNLQRVEQF